MSGSGLVLVGARGTGKSTVGRLVADRLGHRFIDVDDEIEAAVGLSIPEIFSTLGESAFRDAEEDAIRALTELDESIVLATGGGAVVRPSNRERLKRFGLAVWLKAEPMVLGERLLFDASSGKLRPSLTGLGAIAEIEAVLEARREYYQDVAGLVVDTTGIKPVEVADAVLRAFEGAERWIAP